MEDPKACATHVDNHNNFFHRPKVLDRTYEPH